MADERSGRALQQGQRYHGGDGGQSLRLEMETGKFESYRGKRTLRDWNKGLKEEEHRMEQVRGRDETFMWIIFSKVSSSGES